MSNFSHVEIDDADIEQTHLCVSVIDADREIQFIEEFPVKERNRAFRLASKLAHLLNIQTRLKDSPELEAKPIDVVVTPSTS